jgi:hypothetical protein
MATAKKLDTKTVAKNEDDGRVKVMLSDLCAIALKEVGAPPAAVSALEITNMRWLSVYALRHAELSEAQIGKYQINPDDKTQTSANRKFAARLKKFEALHNFLVCKPSSAKYLKKLNALKGGASAGKIQAARKAEQADALAACGIGDREPPNR